MTGLKNLPVKADTHPMEESLTLAWRAQYGFCLDTHAERQPIWGDLLRDMDASPNGVGSTTAPVDYDRLWDVATVIVKEYPTIPRDAQDKAIMPFNE